MVLPRWKHNLPPRVLRLRRPASTSSSPEFTTEVRDVILKPPIDHTYDMLKAQLIKRTAASEQRKLQQLFRGEEVGDRKPTQLLRHIQQLVGDKLGTAENDSFLIELFLQRLPSNVRLIWLLLILLSPWTNWQTLQTKLQR